MSKWVIVLAIVTACGGSGLVEVTDAWAGSTPPNADVAAIYLTVANGTSESVRIASVTSERCTTTEIHESRLDDQQVMRMRPAEPESLDIGRGERLEMRPGALHVMCIGVLAPLAEGETFGYWVSFVDGTSVSGEVTVENR